jgi:gliding motility-associated-like protein
MFEIAHMGIYNYHIYIYNRWGGLVYESNNPDGGWDGKSNGSFCPESVYVFLITYQNSKQVTKSMHGTVTLIR